MLGFVGGKVLASRNEKWREGDYFGAMLPYSTVQILTPQALASTVMWKLTGLIDESEMSLSVGVLGMPGATAYGGLVDVLRPKAGETIFISAASGAVGALVGMIAKRNFGCKVVGSCGGDAKVALAKQVFGFDEVIDYKTVADASELTQRLREVAPGGIDMYFENVGGMHFEAAMATLRPRGRVAVCGQISEYNSAVPALCAFNPLQMVYTSQRIEGFVSFDWLSDPETVFLKRMHAWLREGVLKVQETRHSGLESWPVAFQSLFTGANVGKVVVEV
jgi:NADPH-dependent curcumin reductase CurA